MITRLTPLGTGGWMPTEYRETMCWLLEYNGHALIFDLGSGLKRLLSQRLQHLLAPYDEVMVFLSHFHLDHVAALPYIAPVFGERHVRLYTPSWKITGFSAAEALGRLTSRPLFSLPFAQFGLDLSLVELDEGSHAIENMTIKIRRQKHSDPTIGVRVDDILTYATDTVFDEETAMLAKDCHWLIHECWFDRQDYLEKVAANHPDVKSHCGIDDVMEIVTLSNCTTPILGHLNPTYSEDRLEKMLEYAVAKQPEVILPNDGESLLKK